jgi:phage recombination protein Bet
MSTASGFTTNELAIERAQARPIASVSEQFSRDQLALIKRTVCADLNDNEFALFIEIAKRARLDPFRKQIYGQKRSGKLVTVTGIDGFRLIAQRSGRYAGQLGPYWCGPDGDWKDVWLAKEPPAAARVGILRTDFREPLWAVARFASYNAGTGQWPTMPDVMLAKCAEALGIRKAFPEDVSGLYTDDEMSQADRSPAHEPETGEFRDPKPTAANPASAWMACIDQAQTLLELRDVGTAIAAEVKSGKLKEAQARTLRNIASSRKAKIVARQDGGPPGATPPDEEPADATTPSDEAQLDDLGGRL